MTFQPRPALVRYPLAYEVRQRLTCLHNEDRVAGDVGVNPPLSLPPPVSYPLAYEGRHRLTCLHNEDWVAGDVGVNPSAAVPRELGFWHCLNHTIVNRKVRMLR